MRVGGGSVFLDPVTRLVDWTARSSYERRVDQTRSAPFTSHDVAVIKRRCWRRSLRHPRSLLVLAVALAFSTTLVLVVEGFRVINAEYELDILGKVAALAAILAFKAALATLRDAKTSRLVALGISGFLSSLLNFASLLVTVNELQLNADFELGECSVALIKLILNGLSGCLSTTMFGVVLCTALITDITNVYPVTEPKVPIISVIPDPPLSSRRPSWPTSSLTSWPPTPAPSPAPCSSPATSTGPRQGLEAIPEEDNQDIYVQTSQSTVH